jgi:hypothetical protein
VLASQIKKENVDRKCRKQRKKIRESTQILVGKSDEKKQRRKYVAVGGRIILKCILSNGV